MSVFSFGVLPVGEDELAVGGYVVDAEVGVAGVAWERVSGQV